MFRYARSSAQSMIDQKKKNTRARIHIPMPCIIKTILSPKMDTLTGFFLNFGCTLYFYSFKQVVIKEYLQALWVASSAPAELLAPHN
jgi:hypothetical protein